MDVLYDWKDFREDIAADRIGGFRSDQQTLGEFAAASPGQIG
ncbi:hypothetical protein [uncultured Deefgea sp.]|nr:hypothetical protein [uncultured Deefgea sp.]